VEGHGEEQNGQHTSTSFFDCGKRSVVLCFTFSFIFCPVIHI
jgi:hypothetical protein